MELGTAATVLAGITFFAAFVNGALGYGFSSLTVPVALLFYSNRVLNPPIVLVEVFINIYVLIMNRDGVALVWKRIYPILFGLIPGIVIGSYLVGSIHPAWLRFGTYAALLPLVLIQAAGIRRPIRSEKRLHVPFGAGLGFLYSATTISGPPMALFFNNQGLAKRDFRAALALVRVAEATLTLMAYRQLDLFTAGSFKLVALIAPSLLVGVPLGAFFIRRFDAEKFRRIAMSFDAWIVAFGLSRTLAELHLVDGAISYSPLLLALFCSVALQRFPSGMARNGQR